MPRLILLLLLILAPAVQATLTGSVRYGLNGQPAGVVTEEEYRLSRLRLEKVLKLRE
ncbi:hypothetical protein L6F73_003639 [Salmonella enterica]|uniref:hypothetical protein n=1 Tax=Salmonella enterica TaxID=28901 RepID=UPI00186B514F|nr:hypothetical protein [Salmonella enterica]HCI4751676.1 hypothetical protein [Salmonella enterica subsp. enterica serovar Kintambo]EDR5750385.1 hypothetical protein [Salmonella enterica subsp. enterica serovar Cubana]EDT3891610.1 hypothetical protein [Salmonella enterica subsp. enterica serovar Cubana]EDW3609303.1 hypothetical protein [Salmonella enterica]EDZ2279459.1 hypothetical protein [Salmonella enterica]